MRAEDSAAGVEVTATVHIGKAGFGCCGQVGWDIAVVAW